MVTTEHRDRQLTLLVPIIAAFRSVLIMLATQVAIIGFSSGFTSFSNCLFQHHANVHRTQITNTFRTGYLGSVGVVRWHDCQRFHGCSVETTSEICNGDDRVYRKPSVSGVVYENSDKFPTVKLFTKEGCTLCDKVKEILLASAPEFPHSLIQVDITDETNTKWYDQYKYDIPVLHINDVYWTKHKLNVDDIKIIKKEIRSNGVISPRLGEPNAERRERKAVLRPKN